MGFASPDSTSGWDFHPAPVGGSCETRPCLWKFSRSPHGRGADSSAFLASHNLRTIQRDGRDAVGLRLPKPSAADSRLSELAEKLSRSVFRLRRASRPFWDIAPRSRGEAGRARPLAITSLRSCARPSVCAASLRFASAHRVGGGRGAAMPRPLLDSVKNGRSFAASEEAVLPWPDVLPVSSEPAKRFCISGYLKSQISNLISGRGPRSPVGWAIR